VGLSRASLVVWHRPSSSESNIKEGAKRNEQPRSIVAKMYHSTGGVLGVLRVLRACCGPKFVPLI